MNYEYRVIVSYKEHKFYDKDIPYRWHIEYAKEFNNEWKELFSGWSKNPEQAFKDANKALEVVRKNINAYVEKNKVTYVM